MTGFNHTKPKPIWEEKEISQISYGGKNVTKSKFKNLQHYEVSKVDKYMY